MDNVIQIKGEVQLLKRRWYQFYKKGWYKHTDFWNNKWWIRFNWPISESTKHLPSGMWQRDMLQSYKNGVKKVKATLTEIK